MPFEDREGRMCGFLNIEETEGSGSFCRRYFVLDRNNDKLVYYMDSPANLPQAWRSPVGEIFIHCISKVSDSSQQRPKVQFNFTITVTGHTYCLQAETEQGKQEWIKALKNASKITVPEKSVCSTLPEWHGTDVSQGYITEIAGGVVCKMPIQTQDVEADPISEEEESRSSSSSTPPSSYSRASQHIARDADRRSDIPIAHTAVRSGYCVKQGAVRKNWKRRFFALHDKGLSYFKSDQDKNPLRTIALDDILAVRSSSDGAHPNRDNLFEVVTSKRVFYIQCDTPSDMSGWIEALNLALHRKQFQGQPMMPRPGVSEELVRSGSHQSKVWL